MNTNASVTAYTDGGCRGNPGPGGWGVVLCVKGQADQEFWGHSPHTTNNRMELTAAIEALQALPAGESVLLVTDSEYLVKGMQEWLPRWRANGWKTARKRPVLNADLWRTLSGLCQHRNVSWRWTKGHADDPGNLRADALANRAMDGDGAHPSLNTTPKTTPSIPPASVLHPLPGLWDVDDR